MLIGILIILFVIFGIGFAVTGAILKALLWFIKLPIVLAMWGIGVLCCCTILLIPVGINLFKAGGVFLI